MAFIYNRKQEEDKEKDRNLQKQTPAKNTQQPAANPVQQTASAQTQQKKKPIVKPGQELQKFQLSKSPYQQNVAVPKQPQKWYKGDQPTTSEIWGQIYRINQQDPQKAQSIATGFMQAQQQQGTQWWNPYARPTNQAVDILQSYGIDTNELTDEWYAKNTDWQKNLKYGGTTNTPQSPGMKATPEQIVAYNLYQYRHSDKDTKKAQEEAAALRQEIAYKANDPNHNYTDDAIIDGIDWKKYPTLAAANEGKVSGKLSEFNSAINFTDDDMRGWIWAARNGIEEDDNIYNMAMSALGEGKQWEENPGLSAKLDKKGTDYSPFQAGMTLDPEVGLYFGKYSFDRKTIDELWQTIDENDETAVKMLRKADAAVTLRETAQEELDQLNEFVRKQIESNRNPEDIKKKIETKMTNGVYPTLAKMDESIEKPWGGIVELGSAIDYSRNSLYASIDEKCAGRDGRKNGGEVQNDITKDAAAVAPVVPEDVDAMTGADVSVPKNTMPVLTDADIETGKEKDRGRQEASSVADDYMAENEQTVMAKTGSSFFPGTRQYFQGIVDNFVDAFGDITAGAAAVAEKASGICNQAFFESALANSYDISVYDNYKTQLKEDQEKIAEYEQKYGSVEQYQEALAEKFSPEKVFVLDDWHNAVLQYDEETNEYKVAEITGEIDSLEDYQSLNAQADRLAQQNSAKAKAAMESMKRYESYSDEEKADIQDYKNRVVRAAKAQEYLDENAQDYAEKTALMNERTESLASVMQAREWLGMDNDAMYGMMDMLTFMGQYYDQPRLPSSAKTELQQFDEMYMNAATPEQRKAFVEESEKKIRDEIDGIRMSIEQAENAGYKIPDNLRQNMQYRLEDLAYRYQSFEYYKVLTDVSAEERDKAIEAGKAFEKKYGDYMESWEAYFGDDQPDDTFTTLHNRDKYQFTDVATYNEKDENGNLVKKSMDIITDDDDAIYYYLLGKKVLEEGGEFDKLWDKKDWTAEETEQTKNLLLDIFSDSNEFVDHMDNDDYGAWRSRTSDYIGTSAQGMVDESFLMGAAANVVATIATPVESIASALYILDRKINNKRINPDASARDISVFKENTRAATQKSIKDTFGEGTFMEKLASLGYEVYSSRGDSLVISMLLGPMLGFSGSFGKMLGDFAGASPMGVTAALNAAAHAVENGATTEQAWLIAGVTFLSETFTEAITYGNLQEALGTTKELTSESLKSFFTEWLTKNGWEEAFGESLNDYLENAAEQWAQDMKKDPEAYLSGKQESIDRYKAEGYTDEEAEELALKDEIGGIIHTAFVSFLSAGSDVFLKAGKAAVNTANYIRIDTKLKQKAGYGDSMWQNALNEWRRAKGYAVNEASTETAMDKVVAGEQAVNEQTGEGATAQTETSDNEKRVRNNERKQEALDRGAKKGKKKGNTDQQQAAADVMAIERAKGTDDSTQSAAMASALTTKTKSGTDFRAETASAFIGKIFGQNGATTVQNILTTAAKMGRNLSAMKQAIKNAALGDGAATKLVQSDLFKAARPEERVNLLLQASQADSTDGNVQNNINVKVSDFRKTQKIAALMDQGHFDQAKADRTAAEKAAETAQRQKDTLESQRNSEAQAAENVAKTGEQVTNDPTPDNVEQNHKAVEEHKSQTIVTEQMEQAVQKAEQDQQAAEEKADKSARDAMVTARETASQEVAQEDQQIAQAEAEQEQAEAQARQQEADAIAAQQAEQDRQTGKDVEDQQNSAIDQTIEQQNLTPEESEEKSDRAKERRTQIKERLTDLKKPVSNVEGMVAVRAFGRKLGIDIQFAPMDENIRGKYANGVVYLNSNRIKSGKMSVGQALVEAALHEITHAMQQTGAYQNYRKIALQGMYGENMTGDVETDYANNADYRAKIDSIKQSRKEGVTHEDLTNEKADEEIIADFARLNLAEKEVVQRFMDAGMGGRMRNALHNINQALKNFFKNMTGEERRTAEYLRKAERAFQKAMVEYSQSSVHPQSEQFSVVQFAQSAGLTVNTETLELFDNNGNVIDGVKNKVTPDMINNTPVGMLIDLARDGSKTKKGNVKFNPTISEETAQAQKQMFADLMNMVAQYKDSNLVWEIASSTMFSALKSNSDPQYSTTVDFGTVCAKTQEIIDVMSQVMLKEGRGLTREEVLKVYNETANAGLTVPCPVCYVFSRWMGVPSLLNQMSQYQKRFVKTNADGTVDTAATAKAANDYIKSALEKYGDKEGIDKAKTSLVNRMKTQEKNRTDALAVIDSETATAEEKAAAQKKHDAAIASLDILSNDLGEVEAYNWVTQALCKQERKGKKVTNVLDKNGNYVIDPDFQLTPDEVLFDLRRTGDFAKYTKNWTYRNTRGAGMGKAIMPYSGMSIGDIIFGTTRKSDAKNPLLNGIAGQASDGIKNAINRAKQQNLIGGQRLQSTSDFRPEWGLDYMMAFLELQAVGSKVQMYTKVAEAVDLLASMGGDINLSIMGKGQGWHTDENGNRVLDFSDVTGMNYEVARELKEKYDNVQMILVGMNDIHIQLALENPDIDFVIPWHSSGNSKDVLSSLVSSVGENLETSSDYTDTQSDQESENQTEEQKNLWNLRLKILQGKKLSESDRQTIYNDTYLNSLYERFNVEGKDPDCYKVKLGSDQAKQIFPYEYWNKSLTKEQADGNGQGFIDYCQHFGIVPRFSGVVKHNDDGTFSVTGNFAGAVYDENGNITGYDPEKMYKGYWKVLIDRPMYDNNGAYRDQQVVDVTKAKIGTIQDGKLTDSDMPLSTSAMYGPKYSQQEKDAVDNSLAAIHEKADIYGAQNSVYGDMTEADLDLMDDSYMSAVESGDTETAQQVVDDAAEQAGYTIKAYHGTPDARGIGNYFDPNKAITGPMPFFTESESLAEEYAHNKQLPSESFIDDQYQIDGTPVLQVWDNLSEEEKNIIADNARHIVWENGELRLDPNKENDDMSDEIDSFHGNVVQAIFDEYYDFNGLKGDQFVKAFELAGINGVEYINPRSEKVYSTYLKIQNPFDVSTMYTKEFLQDLEDWWIFNGSQFEEKPSVKGWHKNNVNMFDWVAQGLETDIPYGKTVNWTMIPDGVVEYLKTLGYDGIKDQSGKFGGNSETVWIPFTSEQIKSSDPVTYDDQGNVIPLSERFNTENPDIRYSTGSDMTEADMDLLETDQTLLDAGVITKEELTKMQKKEGGPKQRQWGTQMAQNMDELSDQAQDYVLAHSEYTPDTNKEQIERAVNWFKNRAKRMGSMDEAYSSFLSMITDKKYNYRTADGQAKMAVMMGMAVARNDVHAQVLLSDAVNKQGTSLGQALQARKLFLLMTPDGRRQTLQRMLDEQQEALDRKNKGITLKFSDWIYKMAEVAEGEGDLALAKQAAAAELAEQIPANWKDRLNTIRMLSMLANPRTHGRNFVGNLLFEPFVGLKNKMGAILEAATLEKGERTKTLRLVLDKDIREFARQDARANKALLTGEAKYNEATMIKQNQAPLGKFVKKLSDFNSNALEGEDWFFLRGHYRKALGGWMQANGYTVEDMKAHPELLEKGRAYAVDEAQKATYRDFNKIAQQLNDISRKGGPLGFMVDAVLPFKKTPANILRRGIEYSPIGVARSVYSYFTHLKDYNNYQQAYAKYQDELSNYEVAQKEFEDGKRDTLPDKPVAPVIPDKAMSPNQVIDQLTSGLSGSAVVLLGYLLAGSGAITCGLDDDEDKFEKAKGLQEYSVNYGKVANDILGKIGVPRIFGEDATYTIDWAAPMSMPLFVGAALRDYFDANGFNINDFINAFGSITEPVFNLSMLDGVNSLLKTNSYDNTNPIMQIASKIATNYAGSFVPSFLGAIARTFDETQRKAFVPSDKSQGIVGNMLYAHEQAQNKIPGYNKENIPVRDIWGEEKKSGDLERLLENFISPGYYNEYKNDPIINEQQRLYLLNPNENKSMLLDEDPDKTIEYTTTDKVKHKKVLTDKEWDLYKEVRGKTAHKELTELLNSSEYQNALDSARIKMIDAVWKHADKVGRQAVVPDIQVDQQNVAEIAKDSKIKSLEDEVIKALKAEEYDTYDTMVEAIREEYEDDNEADQAIKTKVSRFYINQWKEAYRNNDTVKMDEIEELLEYTGYDFNIYGKNGWMEQEDKKMNN